MRKLLIGAAVVLVGMASAIPTFAMSQPPGDTVASSSGSDDEGPWPDDPTVVPGSPLITTVDGDMELGSGSQGPVAPSPLCNRGFIANDLNACVEYDDAVPSGTKEISLGTDICNVPDDTDFESHFTQSTDMYEYFHCILPELEAWIDAEFYIDSTNISPIAYIYIPAGVEGELSAPGSERYCSYNEMSYSYCNLNGTVYLGELAAWKFFEMNGDMDPELGLAHELGHRFQHASQVGRPNTENGKIPTENQADCITGAYMSYLKKLGVLDRSLDDDLADAVRGLEAIGEAPTVEASHGTDAQRVGAFWLGYNSELGIFACNVYVTDKPIIVNEEGGFDRPLQPIIPPTTTTVR